MRKVSDHRLPSVLWAFLLGWSLLNFFVLGPAITAHNPGWDEDSMSPAAAVYLGGAAAGMWLLSHLFDLPVCPDRDYGVD